MSRLNGQAQQALDYLSLQSKNTQTWIVEKVLPVGGFLLLYADAKIGKSWAALQLAASLASASDEEWLTFPIQNHGTVLYLQLDTPRGTWCSDYITPILQTGTDLSVPLFFVDKELVPHPFNVVEPSHNQWLRAECERLKPLCVVVDVIREAHSLDENRSEEMYRVCAALDQACAPAALVVLAHARKPQADQQPDIRGDSRGSNYLIGRADTIFRFTRSALYYTGRTLPDGHMKLARTPLPLGYWLLNDIGIESIVKAVIRDDKFPSLQSKLEVLEKRLGRSQESCRLLVQRFA